MQQSYDLESTNEIFSAEKWMRTCSDLPEVGFCACSLPAFKAFNDLKEFSAANYGGTKPKLTTPLQSLL